MEGNGKQLKAQFLQEKTTKRMVRMYEVDNGTGEMIVGTLYVSQSALRKVGYTEGDTVEVTLSIRSK